MNPFLVYRWKVNVNVDPYVGARRAFRTRVRFQNSGFKVVPKK